MFATIPSAVVEGVDGHAVSVEVHVSRGLPGYTLVGLPDASCRESRDRVRAAILSCGLEWPNRRVTINLAPTGLRKHGAALDLPIALGILVASGQIDPAAVAPIGAVGELGLDGSIRRVSALVCLAGAVDAPLVVVPAAGGAEATVVRPEAVRSAPDLGYLVAALRGEGPPLDDVRPVPDPEPEPTAGDLAEVRGQPLARWAIEVAAAGGHHLLLVGPPGSGKTMLASRLVGLLPALEPDVALLVTRIHSAAGVPIPPGGVVWRPPLRAPHHGASLVSLVGGGTAALRPGEISCAHGGVLFLDELGEFAPSALDALRQPLEEGVVRVTRAARSATLPADVLLVAAMNPCPCGEGGAPGRCRCSDAARARYSRRLSGPLLDRFDVRIEVRPPAAHMLLDGPVEESTAAVAERVARVRGLAAGRGVNGNAALTSAQLDEHAPLTPAAKAVLRQALETGRLTGRGLTRVRTVARTIVDLLDPGRLEIDDETVAAALAMRALPVSVLGGGPAGAGSGDVALVGAARARMSEVGR
ncbi:MAG: YifB family Mg chelatase-like AAA ATPase [Acidimicrobiales bacterium]